MGDNCERTKQCRYWNDTLAQFCSIKGSSDRTESLTNWTTTARSARQSRPQHDCETPNNLLIMGHKGIS